MELTRDELSKKIGDLIKLGKEGKTWDFKAKWYVKAETSELVKDIICMANNPTPSDAYIIIGVDEKTQKPLDDYCLENDPSRKSEEDLITSLSSDGVKFANNNIPEVRLETIQPLGCGFEVDVIIIKSTNRVPYYLTKVYKTGQKDTGKIESNTIYVRRGSRNSKAGPGAADFPEIEALWKKRFGLTLSIEERFELLLSNKDDWDCLPYEQTYNYLFSYLFSEKIYIVHKYCSDFFIEIDWNGDPLFGRYKLFPTFCCDWCNNLSYLKFGVLRLMYRKFLVNEFRIVCIDGVYFVCPSYVFGHEFIEFGGYFYFIENDVKFNINNILKKVCKHQLYQRRKWVPVNPPEDAFIEEDGLSNPYLKDRTNDEVSSIHEHMKKYIIYFKDKEEKNKYQDYLVNNKEAIRNDLKNLNLNDNIFKESLLHNFGEKMDIDQINRTVELHCIGKFFVKNFYKWKLLRLLLKDTSGRFADYWYGLFCDDAQFFNFNIVPRCCKDFNCHLPDFIAYLPVESEIIFRYECDEYTLYYRNENEKDWWSYKSWKFKGTTVSVCDGEYNVGLISPNKNDGAGGFCYFYFFEDSVEYKINNIILRYCLTLSEVFDKINGRFGECKKVFDSYMIHFKDEDEKGEFDKYLEEHKENVLNDINDFYEINREKFEKDCEEKIRKIYPNSIEQYYPWKKQEVIHKWQKYCNEEFSKPGVDEIKIQEICARANKSLREEVSKLPQKCEKIRNKMDVKINAAVEKMVRVGVFAEKVTEIFGEWKKEKAQARAI